MMIMEGKYQPARKDKKNKKYGDTNVFIFLLKIVLL